MEGFNKRVQGRLVVKGYADQLDGCCFVRFEICGDGLEEQPGGPIFGETKDPG